MASTISAGTTTTTSLVYTADTSGVLQLQTNGTTTAVTIDTNQNVGFGVTPSSWAYGSGGKALEFPDAGAIWTYSSSSGINFSQNVYYNGAYYYKNTGAATLYGQGSGSHIWYNAVSGTGGTTFTPTQAMTLDNSSNLLHGVASVFNGGKYSQFANLNGGQINITLVDTGTTGGTYIGFYNNTGAQAGIITHATSTTVLYTATSDKRLKENIIDSPSAIDYINSVKIRSYDWIEDKHQVKYGVIAQELFDVEPNAVVQGDTNLTVEKTWSVDTSYLVPALIKCVQELSAKVTALEAKVGA